jgi:polar amino acid transport system substrate-binding protein
LVTDTGADDITGFRKLLAAHIDLFPIEIEVGQYLLQKNFPADCSGLIPADTSIGHYSS